MSDLRSKMQQRKYKYKSLKKYKTLKNLNNNLSAEADKFHNELILIGPQTEVSTQKLTCCRNNNYSKYTADLLDIIFGRETLSTCVQKEIAGCLKPPLDPTTISEIQMHVASKFNVSLSQIRNVIRQKLNTEEKSWRKKCLNK